MPIFSAKEMHLKVFSEEYDYMRDSLVDAQDRSNGLNPMSEDYNDRIFSIHLPIIRWIFYVTAPVTIFFFVIYPNFKGYCFEQNSGKTFCIQRRYQ